MDDLFSRARTAEQTPDALSVTQLLRRMKNLLERQIGEIRVEGEVSNLKKQASGHWYFSLKDEGAQIQCAMFGARNRPGSAFLEDGAKVRALAEASVYEARGQLQIIVREVERAGLGDLQARFEALKRKLQAEGLFEAARKRPLPRFPRTVGIVTSGSGAAIRDILNVIQRRAPWVQPVLFPVRVQGKGAEHEIADAVRKLGMPEKYGFPPCDVLIVGRGGGSLEDLWCFNEEVVARAIAASPIPVISAVGHEIDFTIADFVADLRAPTPSAAAELAVPDAAEWLARLEQIRRRLVRHTRERLAADVATLERLKRGVLRKDGERLLLEPVMRLDSARSRVEAALKAALKSADARVSEARTGHRTLHPLKVLDRRLERVEALRARLGQSGGTGLVRRVERLARLTALIRALGPESAFQRGFSITLGPDGRILRSIAEVAPGEEIRTRLLDGTLTSRVEGSSS